MLMVQSNGCRITTPSAFSLVLCAVLSAAGYDVPGKCRLDLRYTALYAAFQLYWVNCDWFLYSGLLSPHQHHNMSSTRGAVSRPRSLSSSCLFWLSDWLSVCLCGFLLCVYICLHFDKSAPLKYVELDIISSCLQSTAVTGWLWYQRKPKNLDFFF